MWVALNAKKQMPKSDSEIRHANTSLAAKLADLSCIDIYNLKSNFLVHLISLFLVTNTANIIAKES